MVRADRRRSHKYYLYGLCLRSHWRLPYSERPASYGAEVSLVHATCRSLPTPGNRSRRQTGQPNGLNDLLLDDGRTYLRWPRRFEFVVSADGRTIAGRPLQRTSGEIFHTYLLNQALSFALVKQGFDPLHATVVVVGGAAIALLGDSGYGKSTLAASFLEAGHSVLTDDLLVLSQHGRDFLAHPGPPRMKLFPDAVAGLGLHAAAGTPISRSTAKLLIPLDDRQVTRSPVRLRRMYVLPSPPSQVRRRRVTIRRLTRRAACVELFRGVFNTSVADSGRLARQFDLAAKVSMAVPVCRINYPRSLRLLPAIRDAIISDLASQR